MRSAFVAVIGEAPGAVPAEVRAILRAAQPPAGVPFDAADHLEWADATDTVLVGAWREVSAAALDAVWHVDQEQLSIVVGHVRRRGSPWLPPDGWPTLLASLLDPSTAFEVDDLVGVFSGLVIDVRGDGVAVTDAFSHHGLYVARGRAHAIVATNPALAAWAIKGELVRPELDPIGVCGLAYTTHRVGERTGFAGVRSLPMSTHVEVRARSAMKLVHRRPPWMPGSEIESEHGTELVDLAQRALEEELEANVGFPVQLLLTDLTGGKDTRLVLALALTAGVADQLLFRTQGPATIRDVVIARELAELVGVRWIGSADFPGLLRDRLGDGLAEDTGGAPTLPWAERMRRYVATTAGMCNILERRGPTGTPTSTDSGQVARINGLAGELLRSSLTFEIPDQTALVRRFDRHFGHLELLRPDAFRLYREEWIVDLLADAGVNSSCNDRCDAFLLRSQVRSNFGPKLALSHIHRLMPLSSPIAVRAAFALGGAARATERLHREIVTRASPALSTHPFAKDGWHRLRPAPVWARPSIGSNRRRRRASLFRTRLDRPPATEPPRSDRAHSLAHHRRDAEGSSERVKLMDELLADRSNAAWDLIDRESMADAVRHYDLLRPSAQAELMGATTAALWLADGSG